MQGEYGHGQHELNVKYDDALAMADNHVIYKQWYFTPLPFLPLLTKPQLQRTGGTKEYERHFHGQTPLRSIRQQLSHPHVLVG